MGGRSVRLAVIIAATALMATGCGIRGLQSYHLPGGSAGGDAYDVVVIFDDVTALEPQASVRVADVPVGDIDKLEVCRVGTAGCPDKAGANGFRARVTARIKRSVVLPANAVAVVKQTSLLGEKYVEIGPAPDEAPTGELPRSGEAPIYPAVIPADKSREEPDLEEVFGALSVLLNGGGIEQLQTIATELSATFSGRETDVKDFLRQLDTFVGGLDSNKSEIVRALDSLDRFSKTLAEQRTTIATALTDIAPGLKVLADNEPDLTDLLQALSRLGTVATRVIRETKTDTIASFQSLQPTLEKLASAGDYLPRALEVLVDYPFPKNATNAVFGDYTGLLADIDLESVLSELPIDLPLGGAAANGGNNGKGSKGSGSGKKGKLPKLPDLPTLPGLPDLPLPGGINTQTDSNGLLDLLTGGLR